MMELTKEQLTRIIESADDVLTAIAGTNDDIHPESDAMLRAWDDLNDRHATPEIVREMARQLLAGLEQEPVEEVPEVPELSKVIYHFRDWNEGFPIEKFKADYVISWMLANYPPAPPSAAPQLPHPAVPECFTNSVSALESLYRNGQKQNWNERYTKDMAYASGVLRACRAAMLQGAEPVSQHPELTVWYGSMPETNGKANWTAILHRKGEGIQDGMTIDRSEYPDRVLYAADRVRYLIGEKADRPCILDYDADAHSGYVKPGNCPVVPDGWIPVSERMPEEIGRYWCYVEEQNSLGKSHYQWNCSWNGELWGGEMMYGRVTHWMPLPNPPKKEVQ